MAIMIDPNGTDSPWRSDARRWLLAVLAAAIATGARYALDPVLPTGFPFVTYLPAVLLVALVAGQSPALLTAAIGMVVAWYLFLAPVHSFAIDGAAAIALLLYAATCAIGLRIIGHMEMLTGELTVERDRNAGFAAESAALAAEAQAGRERLNTLIWQLPVGILEADLDGRLDLANNRAAELLGRPANELIGVTILELAHIADRGDLRVILEDLAAGQDRASMALRATGAGRPALLLHFAVARDASGQPQALLMAIERG